MSAITTHVLDTSQGRPAAGVPVALEIRTPEQGWQLLGSGETDADGRLRSLLPADARPAAGVYRLTFDTDSYFRAQGAESFYPLVAVVFRLDDAGPPHYHVPLLVSPYGYTTYRGS